MKRDRNLKTSYSQSATQAMRDRAATRKCSVHKLLLVLSLALISTLIWVRALQDHCLEVIFFDVGQGDSILILFPGGGNMLVDGGEPKQAENVIIPYLRKRQIKKIDVVVLTHAHSDHIGGLITILKTFPVGFVIESGFPHTTELYLEFLETVYERKIRYSKVFSGDHLAGFRNVEINFLNPPCQFIKNSGSDINNNSVVFKLSYGETEFLFCGDIEKESEEKILNQGYELQSQIIKVPHHGSTTSSSLKFIRRVKPEIAIILAGRDNRFEHPHIETIRRYKKIGSKIYRTDIHGAIIIYTDGKQYKIKTLLRDEGVVKIGKCLHRLMLSI